MPTYEGRHHHFQFTENLVGLKPLQSRMPINAKIHFNTVPMPAFYTYVIKHCAINSRQPVHVNKLLNLRAFIKNTTQTALECNAA